MTKPRILLVEDEPSIRFAIRSFLYPNGILVEEASAVAEAKVMLAAGSFDAVIADYMLGDGTALEILPLGKETVPELPVIILTGHGTVDLAVTAMQKGAEQFLTKPIDLKSLLAILNRTLENRRNRRRVLSGQERSRSSLGPFVGTSKAILAVEKTARRLATTDRPILIQGETGAGKGVLAKWLHENSDRSNESFVDLNCAGLTPQFLESELFGHEKGAFTGAIARKPGLLEVADKGTVFLDEIGDMDPVIQPKLLKVLEERKYRRLGDVRDRSVDIRLIAATHHDLAHQVTTNVFRADLYFRIATLPLRVPSLRERKEDLPVLIRQIIQEHAASMGRKSMAINDGALKAIQEYSWPGNIRELRNVLERAILLSDGPELTAQDLHFDTALVSGKADLLRLTHAELERLHIQHVLDATGGNVPASMRWLGIPRSTLYHKIKKLRLTVLKQL